MPIQRFEDSEAARRALWIPRGDARLAERIRALWAFSTRLAPGALPRGLWRFGSLDEANREREMWRARRARELRAARRRA